MKKYVAACLFFLAGLTGSAIPASPQRSAAPGKGGFASREVGAALAREEGTAAPPREEGTAALPQAPATGIAAAPERPEKIMGEYAGLYTGPGSKKTCARALVIAEGKGEYLVRLFAGPAETPVVELNRDLDAAGVALTGASKGASWTGRISGGSLVAEAKGGKAQRFDLVRIEPHSPTEGLAPPAGAVVLLPFGKGEKNSLDAWTNKDWKLLADGSVMVTHGPNRTVRFHGSGLFHLEFMTPLEPGARGQGRGNSGVYFESRYEVQILDSFGLEPGLGDCGSIYGVAASRKNASFPPLSWQTYDVIFQAPRKKADGSLEPARMTVFQNGVKIHENQPVPGPTRAAPEKTNAPRGPLYLQDHGHPVRFRNIWYLELPE